MKKDGIEEQITEENIKNINPKDYQRFRYYRIEREITGEETEKDLPEERIKEYKLFEKFETFNFARTELTELSEMDKKLKNPNHISKTAYFQNPEITYFNLRNFIAFLLHCSLFLIYFVIFYFDLYFLFVFLYTLIFIDQEAIKEKNKFLFALHKARDAVLFFNLYGLLKIIPLICFLIDLFFHAYYFFKDYKKGDYWVPLIFDVEEKRFMNLPNVSLELAEKKEKVYIFDRDFFESFNKDGLYF